jgi:hypothetical protein
MPDRGPGESTIIKDGSQFPERPGKNKLEPTANTESPFIAKNLSPKVLITALLQVWGDEFKCQDCFYNRKHCRCDDIHICFRNPPLVDQQGSYRPEVYQDDPICGEFIPKREALQRKGVE